MKFSPSIDITKGYMVLKFGGNPRPDFEKKGVKVQTLAPYISETGAFGGRNFFALVGGQRV